MKNKILQTLLIAATAFNALSASYSPPESYVNGSFDWYEPKILSIEKFNSSLGNLTNVIVEITAGRTNTFKTENLSGAVSGLSFPLIVNQTNELYVEQEGGVEVVTIQNSWFINTWLSGADGNPSDFLPPAGLTTNNITYYNNSYEYSTDLNNFIGIGNINYFATSKSYNFIESTDNRNTIWTAEGFVKIKVTYFYEAPCVGIGVGTIGFWKNHTKIWPVQCLKIGCAIYNKTELLCLLRSTSNSPESLLVKQLIAAKLNILADECNKHSCVDIYIREADYLICTVNNCPNKKQKERMLAIKTILDNYNNGCLCEKSRK